MSDMRVCDLIDLRRKGRIIVPPYQRDAHAWSLSDKAAFVNNVIRGDSTPAMAMNTYKGVVSLLDGLQRSSALIAYVNGDLRDVTLKPYSGGLSPAEQEKFDNYKFLIQDLLDLDYDQAYDAFLRYNKGKRVTLGEKIRGMEFPSRRAGGRDRLAEVAAIVLSLKPDNDKHFLGSTRQDQYKIATHLFVNAGDEIFPTDKLLPIQEEFIRLSIEEADARIQKLKDAMDTTLSIAKNLSEADLQMTKKRRISFLVQMTVAYIGYPKLTTGGGAIAARRIAENSTQFAIKRSSSGTHPYNFSSGTGKFVVDAVRQLTMTEEIFRDRKRDFSSSDKSTMRIRDIVCQKCKLPVKQEDENFHHVVAHEDGGRSNPTNGILLHEKCHRSVDILENSIQDAKEQVIL